MALELELKLDLEKPEEADRLLAALELGAPEARRLHATYFDTVDKDLSRLGYVLRIRQEGRKRVQTLKGPAGPGANPFARQEWERPARGRVPQLDPDGPLATALGDRAPELSPCSTVRTDRRVWTIDTGTALVEMALDEGVARAGEETAAFSEIELELKRGDPAALFDLARRIGRLTPVRLGMLAKAERAQRLLRPRRDCDKASPVALTDDMEAADAFRRICHACLCHYRLNEQRLLAGDNGVALHQCRVSLRRLRSALKAFRPIADGKKARRLNAQLRWLHTQFGTARNIDVVLKHVEDRKARARLKTARHEAYRAARWAMGSAATREMMIDLAEWLSVGKWARRHHAGKLHTISARDFATRAIGKQNDRLVAMADSIAGPDDAQRHEARKAAKRLRYTTEFFALLFDSKDERKARIRYLAAVEELQDRLGTLNDLAVIPGLFRQLGIAAPPSPKPGQQDYLLLRAADAMRLVEDADKFWK